MTTVYDGWYLLDHHVNRNGGKVPWYTTRLNSVKAIVIHTPESLEDFAPPYDEAERVAAYGATTTRASWHDTIDADSIIPMLPPTYTAWHVRGYNSSTIGMEIGAKATSWSKAPTAWVDGVLDNAARRAAQHAVRFGIPPVFIDRTAVNAGKRGFTSHAQLDPTRRTDPGKDFPWDRFLRLVADKMGGDMTPTQARIEVATAWYAKAGVWMDGTSGEDPQARLTRLAAEHRNGRPLDDIVRFVGRVRTPTIGEAVPAWVLDPTSPASAPLVTSDGLTQAQADQRYVIRGSRYRIG